MWSCDNQYELLGFILKGGGDVLLWYCVWLPAWCDLLRIDSAAAQRAAIGTLLRRAAACVWKCEHWLEWQRSAQVTAALTDPVEIRGKAESLHSLCYKLQVIYLTSQFVQSCLLMVKMKQKVNILHSSLCYSDQSSIPSNGLLLLAMVWQLTAGIIFLLLLLPTLINRLWYSGKTPYSTFN